MCSSDLLNFGKASTFHDEKSQSRTLLNECCQEQFAYVLVRRFGHVIHSNSYVLTLKGVIIEFVSCELLLELLTWLTHHSVAK